jgi:hypothetical protein
MYKKVELNGQMIYHHLVQRYINGKSPYKFISSSHYIFKDIAGKKTHLIFTQIK